MKINPIANPNIIRSYQATKPAAVKAERVSSGLDEATFSEEALSFSRMMAETKDKIELRTQEESERIAQIRDAVRQGTYRIDSDKIAERILGSIIGG